jgi:hypothetical protein
MRSNTCRRSSSARRRAVMSTSVPRKRGGAAVAARHQLALGVHPHHAAVVAQDAVVEAVHAAALHRRADAGLRRRAIVRMHHFHRLRQRLQVVPRG